MKRMMLKAADKQMKKFKLKFLEGVNIFDKGSGICSIK
jgi:hypothetical protein